MILQPASFYQFNLSQIRKNYNMRYGRKDIQHWELRELNISLDFCRL